MAVNKLLNEEIDFVGKLDISSTERVQDVTSFENLNISSTEIVQGVESLERVNIPSTERVEDVKLFRESNILSTEFVRNVKLLESQSNSYFIYRVACFVLISLVSVLTAILVFMIYRCV